MILFSEIRFPVFYLGNTKPIENANRIYYDKIIVNQDGTESEKTYVVDDKNVTGATLSVRRLKMRDQGTEVCKLKQAVFFIADLLKLTRGTTWFIDSLGTLFSYKKTTRVPLVFKPVSQIINMRGGGAIVEIEGLGARYKILYAPTTKPKYAGLLVVKGSYILYGLYQEKLPDTYRMI